MKSMSISMVIMFLLISCGSQDVNVEASKQKILHYAIDKNTSAPSVKNYHAIGLMKVDLDNLEQVNQLILQENNDTLLPQIKYRIEDLLNNIVPPIITLNGLPTIKIHRGTKYNDDGARASDDRDGNITHKIKTTSTVNTAKEGTYIVTYTVHDSAKNKAIVQRTVKVILGPKINLKGKEEIIIGKGTVLKDPGAEAFSLEGINLTSSIITDSDVNTSNVGIYHITYSVKDAHGVEDSVSRKIHVVSFYDDMEKSGSHGWKGNPTPTVEYDNERDSKVIFLNSKLDHYDVPLDTFKLQLSEGNRSKVMSWEMKTTNKFVFLLYVLTKKGYRYIMYKATESGEGFKTASSTVTYIRHGIGSTATNGEWHTYTRDIDADIKRYEPENSLVRIEGLLINGKVKLDDIIFSSGVSPSKIQKSAIISEPGIVLTFDDSLVEGWYNAKGLFNEHGAVATWFCNRWAPYVKPITANEAAKLKELASNGDEIGIHTVEHLRTRDKRYDKYTTVEEKAQAYFSGQVKPAIDDMLKRGFEKPESFSYPYISGQPAHNKVIRKELPHIREFFGQVREIDELPKNDSMSNNEIKTFLDKLKKEKEIGVFIGHRIVNKKNLGSRKGYQVSRERLEFIFKYAEKIGLKFYTLKEAHNIYLNQ